VATLIGYADSVQYSGGSVNASNALGDTTSTYAQTDGGEYLDVFIDVSPFAAVSSFTEVRVFVEVSTFFGTTTFDVDLEDNDAAISSLSGLSANTTKQWVGGAVSPAPSLSQLKASDLSVYVHNVSAFGVLIHRIKVEADVGTDLGDAVLSGTGVFSATLTAAKVASLDGAGAFGASLSKAVEEVASLSGAGALAGASLSKGVDREASLLGTGSLSAALALPAVPPWQIFVKSSGWQEIISRRTRTTSARVAMLDDGGAEVASFGGEGSSLGGVVSGSVAADKSRAVRWSCSLTFSNPEVTPQHAADLLGPLSRLRARVYWRILNDSAQWVEVPVGTFVLSAPEITDSGSEFRISVGGEDPSKTVSRALWSGGLPLGGEKASDAIAAILADRAPWAETRITPTDHTLPGDFEPGAPGGDPWKDILRIADAAQMDVYADRLGVIVAEPRPLPGAPRDLGFIEGPGCQVSEITSAVSLDEIANEVSVASSSSDVDPPVHAIARVTDPANPLYIGHGRIYGHRLESDSITTTEQAQALADSTLRRLVAATKTVEVTARARPDIEIGDRVSVGRERARIAGVFRVVSWAAALGGASGMRVGLHGDWGR
jgi:hypothetical protein